MCVNTLIFVGMSVVGLLLMNLSSCSRVSNVSGCMLSVLSCCFRYGSIVVVCFWLLSCGGIIVSVFC